MYTIPSRRVRSRRVRFGAFELDLSTGELRSTEAPSPNDPSPNDKVLLREQVFQVLRMLVERQGKIVAREEIKSRLWGNDTVVDFDQSINAAIKALRRALGDSADTPRYIETLGRRGYRLMVTTESAPGTDLEKDRDQREQSGVVISDDANRVLQQPGSRWWKVAVVLASVATLVGAGYVSGRHFPSATPARTGKIMLAVLPFENLTGDPNKEYLADGLTEETISQLGRLNPEQLGVIARTSVMGYKHKDERLDQIGRDLSVPYVLENSLRENGDRIRLTTQLIQVKDQSQLWSQDYDYPAKDILNVEDDVAKAVAQQIRLRLTSKNQADLAQSHPANPEAFDAYLQGHYYFERDTDKDTEMAAKYYERATQLDPSYALAWVGLSRARKWQGVMGLIPTEEGNRAAREAVERALALNPNLAEAHAQMGRIKQQVDFDWTGADASYRRAVELEPGNPDFAAFAAQSAAILGRLDEALQLTRRAIELDPLNAHSWAGLGEIEFREGKLDKAEADLKKAHELRPDDFLSSVFLSEIYVMQGPPQDALPEIESVGYPDVRMFLYAIAYHALGRKKESDAALRELIAKYQAIDPYLIAEIYAFRSQSDEAFEWLDRAYDKHNDGLIFMNVEPLLKSLHNDPRFAALLKKLNLPI